MTKCIEQWRTLVASSTQQDEERHAQAFAECARSNRLVYRVSLKDPTSGAEVPITALNEHQGSVLVRLTIESSGKEQSYDWTARTPDSVYPLLLE
jgi:hypothetical protein